MGLKAAWRKGIGGGGWRLGPPRASSVGSDTFISLVTGWSPQGSQPAGSDFTQECACRHQVKCEIHSVVSDSLQPHGLYGPWNSPGQNTGVGSLSLLQGIFPTQELNPGLPHCRWILYELSHQGSPGILEWVAYPFSRGSSQPRGRIQAPGVL